MEIETILLVTALVVGFYMSWNIGANDVANAMGTSVGSGALLLRRAVMVAAVLEFSGAFFAGSYVSETVMTGIINVELFQDNPLDLAYGMLASLLAAGVWLQLASYFGWPVSTTHSIIGAILGFGAVYAGLGAIHWNSVLHIVLSWVISPLMGGTIAFFLFTYLRNSIFYRSRPLIAVKKLTPLVTFLVVSILTYFLFAKAFHNLQLSISPRQTLFLIGGVGAVSALASYFWVKRMGTPSVEKEEPTAYNPRVLVSLEKACRDLKKARLNSTEETRFRISQMLSEANELRASLQYGMDNHVKSSEYQSVERVFAFLQILTACLMAFAHGANDVANAIGPIAAIVSVVQTGSVVSGEGIPVWILALGGFGIVVGLATWGWRVIETVGTKITELTPSRGFAAEFAAATTILAASKLGLPISTTHTLIGAILGVGFARGIGAINLNTVRDIVASWLITIPAGAGLAIVFFYMLKVIF